MENPKFYLVHLWGGVEPMIQNPTEPCESFNELLLMTQEFCKNEAPRRDEDTIFYLRQDGEGLNAGSFTTDQLYPNDEDDNGT